jgi:hypothetical protein
MALTYASHVGCSTNVAVILSLLATPTYGPQHLIRVSKCFNQDETASHVVGGLGYGLAHCTLKPQGVHGVNSAAHRRFIFKATSYSMCSRMSPRISKCLAGEKKTTKQLNFQQKAVRHYISTSCAGLGEHPHQITRYSSEWIDLASKSSEWDVFLSSPIC